MRPSTMSPEKFEEFARILNALLDVVAHEDGHTAIHTLLAAACVVSTQKTPVWNVWELLHNVLEDTLLDWAGYPPRKSKKKATSERSPPQAK